MKAALGVALALAIALLPAIAARADDTPPPPASAADLARARALFEQATEALQAGRFAEAVKSLRTSMEIAPRASTAFNLAVALRGTGDAVAAEAMFARLLTAELGPVEPAKLEQVKQLSAEVTAEIATLRIVVSGAEDAELRLDGRLLRLDDGGRGALARVNPGTHHLVATAQDRETVDRVVEAGRGARLEVRIALLPQRDVRPGHVVLTCPDPQATITVDGGASAKGRLETDLPPGEHTVRVTRGTDERVVKLLVPAGRTVKLDLDAPRGSILQRPWFWIGAGVLVAGGAVAVILATRSRERDPISDPTFGVTPTGFAF